MDGNKIHIVSFKSSNNSLNYIVIDTTNGTTTAKSQRIWKETNMIYETIFLEISGSPTFLLDSQNSQIAYQSYSVGEINNSKNNGMVISTI